MVLAVVVALPSRLLKFPNVCYREREGVTWGELEGGVGGGSWRGELEGGGGWRGELEGGVGGGSWRGELEGGVGGGSWRGELEGGVGGGSWRGELEGGVGGVLIILICS